MIIETHLEQLKKTSILVATPMYGGMCTGAFSNALANLFKLAGQYGLSVKFWYLGNESLIPRARNNLAHHFLNNTDCTHLMFIDADIGFNPIDVFTLAIQAKAGTDKAVVCGAYPMKVIDWAQVKAAVDSGAASSDPAELANLSVRFPFNIDSSAKTEFKMDQLNEVQYAGTGFMMIRRDVFESLAPTLHDRTYLDPALGKNGEGEIVTSYFDCEIDPESRLYLSEDYAFCIRARDNGQKIWLCPWIKLAHLGTHMFAGGIADFARSGQPIHKPK